MKRSALWAAVAATAAAISPAAAQQCSTCNSCGPKCGPAYGAQMDSCEEAYIDNSIWPRQYISPARRGICQSTELMIHNGWRRQNLLGKYHFDESSEKLSEAGRLKVDWILTQAPQHRRTVYIQRAEETDQTARRIEAVQTLASNIGQANGPADVQETTVRDDGHPAGAVDAVFTGFSQNQRAPALPGATGGSSSSAAPSSSGSQQ